jgi:outer membrane murein-binding lipoprotein Lpp
MLREGEMNMRSLTSVVGALLLLAGCADEEEPVANRFERAKAEIENKAQELETTVENEVSALENRLDGEASTFLNQQEANLANGSDTSANGL